MKILHIIPTYLPAYRYGGPIECVHSWNVALQRAGHDVTVFTTNIDGEQNLNVPINTPVMKDGVRVFYFKSSFPRSWFYSCGLHHALATRMDEFDVVHITSVFLAASTLGAYYAKKFKKPYIISTHGSLMRVPLSMSGFKKCAYISLIERRNLAGAAAIHFTVPIEEEEYRTAGFPLKKGVVIPNSIPQIAELSHFDPRVFRTKWNIPTENKIVLFLGRISPIKGLDTLIPAFAEVVKKISNATLVIVGGDERGYQREVEKLVRENGLSARVVFTGMLTGEKREEAYKSADVFVAPSVSESFGMSAAEAMRAGIATVLTDGVGIAEDARRANAAIVIKKKETELTRAIVELLGSEKKRGELGERATEFVEREYSEASVAKKMGDAYRQAVGGN